MVKVFIGAGSNLGDRKKNLKAALSRIKKIPGIKLEKVSSFIETKPKQAPGPDYLNAVIKLKTCLKPERLLDILQAIEGSLGRRRDFRNCPRTIDLDILLYGQKRIKTERLVIPHPGIAKRNFVKKPLFEIEPGLRHNRWL